MTDPTDTNKNWPEFVLIATTDGDVTLADRDEAEAIAQAAADELREILTIGDPVSDRVLTTVEPAMIDAEAREDMEQYREAMRY